MREKESLRTLCESLRRERDRAVSDLAEALSESEEMKRQKNLASRQLKELRDRIELEKENRASMQFQYFSNSSSFSESRDSAIDSDLPSGHYSIKVLTQRFQSFTEWYCTNLNYLLGLPVAKSSWLGSWTRTRAWGLHF